MGMVGIVVVNALLKQVPETAFPELIQMTGGHIATQLINGNLEDKFWFILGICGNWKRAKCTK